MPDRDTNAADGAVLPPEAPPPLAPEGGVPQTALSPLRAAPSGAPDPNLALFMAAARDPQVDIAKLERLMALRKEVEEDSRKRAFYAALALAKGKFGPIIKSRTVDYPHKEREDRDAGGRTKYTYEQFADIGAVVDPILAEHGLSYRHRTVQSGGKLTVTCILSHAEGYSEENTLEGLEDKSGQKNPNQSVGSTVTYLQRYTLKQALGIGAKNDDDGMGGGDDDPPITPDDAVYIQTLVEQTDSDLARLLNTVGAESVADMRASQFKQAAWLLETVKRRMQAKAAADGTAQ